MSSGSEMYCTGLVVDKAGEARYVKMFVMFVLFAR